MFIFKSNKRRANIFSPYTDENGTRYTTIPRELLEEIPDPVPPEDFSDDLYYRTEQDDAPYVVFTRKSDEQIEEVRKSKLKNQIDSMERGVMIPRAVREFMLAYMETTFTPEQLAANPGYVKAKQFDDEIKTLRSQL